MTSSGRLQLWARGSYIQGYSSGHSYISTCDSKYAASTEGIPGVELTSNVILPLHYRTHVALVRKHNSFLLYVDGALSCTASVKLSFRKGSPKWLDIPGTLRVGAFRKVYQVKTLLHPRNDCPSCTTLKDALLRGSSHRAREAKNGVVTFTEPQRGFCATRHGERIHKIKLNGNSYDVESCFISYCEHNAQLNSIFYRNEYNCASACLPFL
jgi:hypothetical protein